MSSNSMWPRWIRKFHRFMSIGFTLMVITNCVAVAVALSPPTTPAG